MYENMTPEQEQKIRAFQEHFRNFDWDNDDGTGMVNLARESLDAAGFDFNNREHIDAFMKGILEPQWAVFASKEEELTAQVRDELRKAGATEAQINWGMFEHIHLSRKAERRIEKLKGKIEEVRVSVLPIMSLAVVLNEAREQLG